MHYYFWIDMLLINTQELVHSINNIYLPNELQFSYTKKIVPGSRDQKLSVEVKGTLHDVTFLLASGFAGSKS